jgi:hypothetical protein
MRKTSTGVLLGIAIAALSSSGCFARFDFEKSIALAPAATDEMTEKCKQKLRKKQKQHNKYATWTERLLYAGVVLGVAATVLNAVAAQEQPGDGATDVQDAVSKEGEFSTLEILTLSLATLTALDTGSTTYLGSLMSKRATDVSELVDIVNRAQPLANGDANPQRPSEATLIAKCAD